MDDRDGGEPPAVHPRTQDALLAHYAEMRAGVRAHARRKSRRLLHAVASVAVVLAFAYVEPGRPWVVSAVPVVLTYLFLAHVVAENRAFRQAREVADVERRLDVPGMEFEREHGIRSERAARLHDRLPAYALAGCFFVVWVGSMAAGLAAFDASPPTVAGDAVSVAVPAAVYLVLVAMVTLGTWAYLATRGERRPAARASGGLDPRQRRLDEFAGDADPE